MGPIGRCLLIGLSHGPGILCGRGIHRFHHLRGRDSSAQSPGTGQQLDRGRHPVWVCPWGPGLHPDQPKPASPGRGQLGMAHSLFYRGKRRPLCPLVAGGDSRFPSAGPKPQSQRAPGCHPAPVAPHGAGDGDHRHGQCDLLFAFGLHGAVRHQPAAPKRRPLQRYHHRE